MKRSIKPGIKLQDGHFGLSLDLNEHLPSACRSVLVKKWDKGFHVDTIGIFLPHQLYYESLKKWSEEGKYQLTFEPHYDDAPICIFEEEEEQ